MIESLGSFGHFEFEKTQFGKIDSKPSELTKVYQEYQSKRKKDEPDLTICHTSSSDKITEKQLIALMKAKINGEDVKLPKGYVPLSFNYQSKRLGVTPLYPLHTPDKTPRFTPSKITH